MNTVVADFTERAGTGCVLKAEPEAIQLAASIPLLAVVPYIETARDRQTRLKRTYPLVGVALTLALAATAVLHWLVMPLDLFWSLLMRRVDVAASGLLG